MKNYFLKIFGQKNWGRQMSTVNIFRHPLTFGVVHNLFTKSTLNEVHDIFE